MHGIGFLDQEWFQRSSVLLLLPFTGEEIEDQGGFEVKICKITCCRTETFSPGLLFPPVFVVHVIS